MSSLDIVIPTYQRGNVLLQTIEYLQAHSAVYTHLFVVDQTVYADDDPVAQQLQELAQQNIIHWLRLPEPSIPNAMNQGLLAAQSDVVLFLDDDIIPSQNLVAEHQAAYQDSSVVAVVGQVLQPGETVLNTEGEVANAASFGSGFDSDLVFPFNSAQRRAIQNCIACNLSVRRQQAIDCGGFDRNFIAVAYRFETEFCRRLLRHSTQGLQHATQCLFLPEASLHHLKAPSGGTRNKVRNFLTSAQADHSVGEYYFVLQETTGMSRVWYLLRRYFGCLKARFYLRQPWWVPVRLIGETRGFLQAVSLFRQGARYLTT